MELLESESRSPLMTALRHLRERDLASSREVLGITVKQAEEVGFAECMMALEEGLNLLLSGHHSQALQPLRKAIPLVQMSTDEEARFIMPILVNFADGISRLLQGDAHKAVKQLKLSGDAVKRLNLFIPGLEKLLISCRVGAEIALAKAAINIGDVSEAESIYGRVNRIHQELLSKLDETNPKDFPSFNEIYATQVEFSLLRMRIDLEVLDFDSLDRHIEASQLSRSNMNKFIDRIPENPIKDATEIIRFLFDVIEIYSRVGRRIILDRHPLSESGARELIEADKMLFEAAQKARLAEDRGRMFLYAINQLKRLGESFLKLDAAPTDASASQGIPPSFVDDFRMAELQAIKSGSFDLSRLVQLCREINFCHQGGCNIAIAALTRAILDHVPPIFSVSTFAEVANNYFGGKSFRDTMQHLSNSARKIGDSHLHAQIRRREVLPTSTQVNFANDLDVLLAEIVRLLS